MKLPRVELGSVGGWTRESSPGLPATAKFAKFAKFVKFVKMPRFE
jgi:hypothetical protein